jgi:hypothetical protein
MNATTRKILGILLDWQTANGAAALTALQRSFEIEPRAGTKRLGQARTEIQEAHRLGHPKALAWPAEQDAALIET